MACFGDDLKLNDVYIGTMYPLTGTNNLRLGELRTALCSTVGVTSLLLRNEFSADSPIHRSYIHSIHKMYRSMELG